tara:strand:- start:1234 stop:2532 length:1299 start_codon:yes stop_codon:yes gene_type:complete
MLIQDIIYDDYVEINGIYYDFVKTPEFQRLRDIKQLGSASYIFPSANHTRKEHLIGSYFLADKFLSILNKNQPDLNIEKRDFQNVKLSALLHDIGHCSFSHTFDNYFLHTIFDKKIIKEANHEYRSIKLLDYIINKYNIEIEESDIKYVKEYISRYNYEDIDFNKKKFLFNITNNNINGIDIDKLDYFHRDSTYLKYYINYDYKHIFHKCKIIDDKICYHKNVINNLYAIYNTRFNLHRDVYSHRKVISVDLMISDIYLLCDKKYQISNSIFNMAQFCKITDSFINIIDYDIDRLKNDKNITKIDDDLLKAHKLIKNLKSINYYKCIFEYITINKITTINDIKKYLLTFIDEEILKNNFRIVINTIKSSSINQQKNVFENTNFYNYENNIIDISKFTNNEYENKINYSYKIFITDKIEYNNNKLQELINIIL